MRTIASEFRGLQTMGTHPCLLTATHGRLTLTKREGRLPGVQAREEEKAGKEKAREVSIGVYRPRTTRNEVEDIGGSIAIHFGFTRRTHLKISEHPTLNSNFTSLSNHCASPELPPSQNLFFYAGGSSIRFVGVNIGGCGSFVGICQRCSFNVYNSF